MAAFCSADHWPRRPGRFSATAWTAGLRARTEGAQTKYSYVTRNYVKDPRCREPRWEQIASELIPAGIAITLNSLFGNPKTFDITVLGFTHTVLFLLALTWLFYVTRDLVMYRILWALILLVLTDVGYVAYWNSLYTEPASCLWFLFFLAESIHLCNSREISIGPVLRWSAFAVLWITAKPKTLRSACPWPGMVWRWYSALLTAKRTTLA